MIIDTTCSMVERKMQKALEEPIITFKYDDIKINDGGDFFISNTTFTAGATSPVVFDCEVVFNESVTFNNNVTFTSNINGTVWSQ